MGSGVSKTADEVRGGPQAAAAAVAGDAMYTDSFQSSPEKKRGVMRVYEKELREEEAKGKVHVERQEDWHASEQDQQKAGVEISPPRYNISPTIKYKAATPQRMFEEEAQERSLDLGGTKFSNTTDSSDGGNNATATRKSALSQKSNILNNTGLMGSTTTKSVVFRDNLVSPNTTLTGLSHSDVTASDFEKYTSGLPDISGSAISGTNNKNKSISSSSAAKRSEQHFSPMEDSPVDSSPDRLPTVVHGGQNSMTTINGFMAPHAGQLRTGTNPLASRDLNARYEEDLYESGHVPEDAASRNLLNSGSPYDHWLKQDPSEDLSAGPQNLSTNQDNTINNSRFDQQDDMDSSTTNGFMSNRPLEGRGQVADLENRGFAKRVDRFGHKDLGSSAGFGGLRPQPQGSPAPSTNSQTRSAESPQNNVKSTQEAVESHQDSDVSNVNNNNDPNKLTPLNLHQDSPDNSPSSLKFKGGEPLGQGKPPDGLDYKKRGGFWDSDADEPSAAAASRMNKRQGPDQMYKNPNVGNRFSNRPQIKEDECTA